VATASTGGVQIHHLTPAEIRHDGLGAPGGDRLSLVRRGRRSRSSRPRTAPDGSPCGCLRGRPARRSWPVTRRCGGTRHSCHVERTWRPGDRIRFELPLVPTLGSPRIRGSTRYGDASRVERGPIVYCAESAAEELVEVDPASPLVEHDEGGSIELEAPRRPYSRSSAAGRTAWRRTNRART
jgi:hypothetical protein